jgi:hypothetical protein
VALDTFGMLFGTLGGDALQFVDLALLALCRSWGK